MAKRKGRPAKNPPEVMRFGIKCTDAEKKAVWKKLNQRGVELSSNLTVSEFFLQAIGVR